MPKIKTKFKLVFLGIFAFVMLSVVDILPQNTIPVHEANTNPLGIRLVRQLPREYVAGELVEIVLSIYCDAPDPNYPITAIGIYEMLPSDWSFVSARGITVDPPPIAPAQGTTGTLQFAWIIPPPLPCSFAYTVQVPPGVAGVKTISGQVEYRTNGPRLVSPPTITEINGIDREPPVITLVGDNPIIINQGSNYIEPGWQARDNADGDITARVQITGSVNTQQPGEYTLTYSVRDNAGNPASVTRVVRVVASDSTTPGTTPTSPTEPVPRRPTTVTGPIYTPPPPPTTTPVTQNRPRITTPIPGSPPIPGAPSTSTQTPDRPKPEEVTFPREGWNNQTIPPTTPPAGIARGEKLKPFDIPKDIRPAGKTPPHAEPFRMAGKSTRPTGKVESTTETLSEEKKTGDTSANTEVIATQTTPTTNETPTKDIETAKIQTTQTGIQTVESNTAPLATVTPPSLNNKFRFLGVFSSMSEWWAKKTPPERRNLIGMIFVLALLIILCFMTGRLAYQGVTPQLMKKYKEKDVVQNE